MSPLASLLWSLARALVMAILGFAVAKGWITSDQASQASPELVSIVVIGISTLCVAAHSQWQKYRAGVLASRASSSAPLTLNPGPRPTDLKDK